MAYVVDGRTMYAIDFRWPLPPAEPPAVPRPRRTIPAKEHKDKRTLHCGQCDYSTTDSSTLNKHKKVQHTPKELQRRLYCDRCDYSTPAVYARGMRMHKLTHLSDNEVSVWYKCDQCSYKGKSDKFLKAHKKRHLLNKEREAVAGGKAKAQDKVLLKHSCPHCDYRTDQTKNLRIHVLGKHVPKERLPQLKCDMCEYSTWHKQFLRSHVKRMHADGATATVHQCDTCLFSTRVKRHLALHSAHCPGKRASEPKSVAVPTVAQQDPEHTEESAEDAHRCVQCDKRYKSAKSLAAHRRLAHPARTLAGECVQRLLGQQKAAAKVAYKCKQCGCRFSAYSTLRRHMLTKHDPAGHTEWHYCTICEAKYASRASLRAHIAARHSTELAALTETAAATASVESHDANSEPPADCDDNDADPQVDDTDSVVDQACDESAQTFASPEDFMAVDVEGSEWFECPRRGCKYKTRSNVMLLKHKQTHMRGVHAKDKEVRCDQCGYVAPFPNKLRKHKRTKHASGPVGVGGWPSTSAAKADKWFSCEQCDYKSRINNCLKEHVMKTHMDASQVPWLYCEQCDYRTLKKYNLRNHTVSAHTADEHIDWLQCYLCDYRAVHKTALNAHNAKWHKGPPPVGKKGKRAEPKQHKRQNRKSHQNKPGKVRTRRIKPVDVGLASGSSADITALETFSYSTADASTHVSDVIAARPGGDCHEPTDASSTGGVGERKHKCTECGTAYKKADNLKTHMFTCHGIGDMVRCALCPWLLTKQRLQTHCDIYHGGKTKLDEHDAASLVRCGQCDYATRHKHNLARHVNSAHSGGGGAAAGDDNVIEVDYDDALQHATRRAYTSATRERSQHPDESEAVAEDASNGASFSQPDDTSMHVDDETHEPDDQNQEAWAESVDWPASSCQCPLCAEWFGDEARLHAHLVEAHRDDAYCSSERAIMQAAVRQRHEQSVDDGAHVKRRYVCELCGHRTTRAHLLNVHMYKLHGVVYEGFDYTSLSQDQTQVYRCPHCDYSTTSSTRTLYQHMRRLHNVRKRARRSQDNKALKKAIDPALLDAYKCQSDAGGYACDKCDFKTKFPGWIMAHLKKKHAVDLIGDSEPADPSGSTVRCDECGYTTGSKYGLKQHVLAFHTLERDVEVWYRCEWCTYRSVGAGQLMNHARKKHGELLAQSEGHACDICSRTFKLRSTMMNHCKSIHFSAPVVDYDEFCAEGDATGGWDGGYHDYDEGEGENENLVQGDLQNSTVTDVTDLRVKIEPLEV